MSREYQIYQTKMQNPFLNLEFRETMNSISIIIYCVISGPFINYLKFNFSWMACMTSGNPIYDKVYGKEKDGLLDFTSTGTHQLVQEHKIALLLEI
jgi:amino acid permease